jgi:hypothetical protein
MPHQWLDLQTFHQFRQLATARTVIEHPVFSQQSQAGRIVAPVLQTLQAIHNDRRRLTRPYIANNATHGNSSLLREMDALIA